MDTSYEKLESMSESDAMNVSGLSQDFYHLDSSLCIEVSHITSDLPQVCIANKSWVVQKHLQFVVSLMNISSKI
jgi:hypothetical protein